MVERHDTAMA